MLPRKDKNLTASFLKGVSKIKGWTYHDKIEKERKQEIREFVAVYILQNTADGNLQPRIYYNRLDFLVEHPGFKPSIKALLVLLELSDNEEEFNQHYQKVHAAY